MLIPNSSFLASSSSSSSRAMGMAVTPTVAFASSQSTTTTFLCPSSASRTLTSSSSLIKTSSVSYTPIFRRSSSLRTTTTTTTNLCSSSSDKGVSEKLHKNTIGTMSTRAGVPVFVMMPLDTVSTSGKLNKVKTMNASLAALRTAGVEGVMVDVWWGLVEKDGPLNYNWEAYVELADMVRNHGLKLQMVMSFHQCGGNVGDSCSIPLPTWVLEEMRRDPDIVYTDRSGRRNPEYISLGCDNLPVLRGRTPIQVYSDYMRDFRQKFQDYLGDTIVEIQVGTGPCGELRYPSYPESNATWRFPGIGEFQCYDKYMMASLKAAAIAAGHEEWGHCGPHDAGNYNQYPEETGFFRSEGTWNSDYGKFFLEWYSGMLLDHGDRIFSAAQGIFSGTGAKLSAKVAGIHWHYKSRSHPSELTAGYYNTRDRDGYIPMAKMFASRGVVLNFTCMEMRDEEQQFSHANSSPELLVKQVKLATKAAGVHLAGENALERYDGNAYSQVLATGKDLSFAGLCAFTYLRMNKRLFEGENWREFVGFVKNMSDCSGRRPQFLSPECPSVVGFDHGNYDRRKPESKMAASK